jgi:hypothetical protein
VTPELNAPQTAVVRCRIGDVVRYGPAVRIDQSVDGASVVTAVRGETAESPIAVHAPEPEPVHDHVGYLHPEMGLRTRTALAKAERSRGQTTPYDDDIEAVQERRESLSVETEAESLRTRREAVAAKSAETAQIRERVATLRGKLQAARDHGEDPEQITQELEAAIQELSEIETAEAAARQRLDRARQAARERRTERERIQRLEDRLRNLHRQARSHLVEAATDRFEAAVAAVPGSDEPADPFEADPVTAGLAIARIAAIDAPLVVGCDRFESPRAAHEWLDAPVLKV